MFTNVWKKYLPVIRIMLKKSANEEQVLALDTQDFERAGLKRKSGYKFHLVLKNGKPESVIIDSPLASSLASTLKEDDMAKAILNHKEYHIDLDTKFRLTISCIPEVQLAS